MGEFEAEGSRFIPKSGIPIRGSPDVATDLQGRASFKLSVAGLAGPLLLGTDDAEMAHQSQGGMFRHRADLGLGSHSQNVNNLTAITMAPGGSACAWAGNVCYWLSELSLLIHLLHVLRSPVSHALPFRWIEWRPPLSCPQEFL
jgi:hypothetical protein